MSDLGALDQHELIEAVFHKCGGRPVDELLPVTYRGKKADIVFTKQNLIAEVKSLTSDRSSDNAVSEKLGDVVAKGAAFGAPIIFGTVSLSVNDLPRTVAERAIRVIGSRVRKEVRSAGKQIDETRKVLSMPDAYGLVVFVFPPHIIDQQTLRWLIHDLLQQRGDHAGLDGALLIETPLCFGGEAMKFGDTNSRLWSISGRPFPDEIGEAFKDAWVSVTGQDPSPVEDNS